MSCCSYKKISQDRTTQKGSIPSSLKKTRLCWSQVRFNQKSTVLHYFQVFLEKIYIINVLKRSFSMSELIIRNRTSCKTMIVRKCPSKYISRSYKNKWFSNTLCQIFIHDIIYEPRKWLRRVNRLWILIIFLLDRKKRLRQESMNMNFDRWFSMFFLRSLFMILFMNQENY